MPEIAPSSEQVRAALDELLGWQGISRSPQLTELLRYVVEKTLAGDEASIKAYSIAVDVFGRPHSFDPQSDPIVRVQARRLRTLLEQFYETGRSQAGVQIRLPLGRYVPEFVAVSARPPELQPASQRVSVEPDVPGTARRMPNGLRRFLLNALLGLGFTLIGVALAVGLIRWTSPLPNAVGEQAMPSIPQIEVGTFSNLTGDPKLDDAVASISGAVVTGLGKFDELTAKPAGPSAPADYLLQGAVQGTSSAVDIRATLTHGQTGIIWSMTYSPATDSGLDAAIKGVATSLVRQLGNATGPVYAPDRSWLAQQDNVPADASTYVCMLQFYAWRDTRRLSAALSGIACFDKLLAANPTDALSLAARAALASWREQKSAISNEELTKRLSDEVTDAQRAVTLRPNSSFVREQLALVLARQGTVDDAFAAVNTALTLNPDNVDAMSSLGLFTAVTGDWARGDAIGETALQALASPPPWYYMARALVALRDRRYFDAIDAGQSLAAGDDELGPAIVLAAAPLVARPDLIDRYRPVVMGNPAFQGVGILPRLGIYLRQQVLTDRFHDGLTLAGIPPAALIGPFNPNGTTKN